MANPRGFECYSRFKDSVKGIVQLYDLTYHLYIIERERLKGNLPQGGNVVNVKTSVGEIDHSLTSIYQRLGHAYPYKLRQQLLISAITTLEVYLTEGVHEIFKRTIVPFKDEGQLTISKSYLLNLGSVTELKDKIILKDIRGLTSGGLVVIAKYYKKLFGVDFRNLGVDYSEIEELHIKRHLFVHRDGYTDSDYIQKFPASGYREGQKLLIEHDYLIKSLNKLLLFASLINKQVMIKFPDEVRKPKYYVGSATYDFTKKNLMIELSVLKEKYDHLEYFKTLEAKGLKFSDYIVQITTTDNNCFLFVNGVQEQIEVFFRYIRQNPNLNISKIIEIHKGGVITNAMALSTDN